MWWPPNSADSPASECGHPVRHSHPAGRDVGPSAGGRAERRHPGLQGRSLNTAPLSVSSLIRQHSPLVLSSYKHLDVLVVYKRLHPFAVNHH